MNTKKIFSFQSHWIEHAMYNVEVQNREHWSLLKDIREDSPVQWTQILDGKYRGRCDLRPPIQPARYGLKWKVVLKQRDIYTENIHVVSLISSLKCRELLNRGVLNHRDHCTVNACEAAFHTKGHLFIHNRIVWQKVVCLLEGATVLLVVIIPLYGLNHFSFACVHHIIARLSW